MLVSWIKLTLGLYIFTHTMLAIADIIVVVCLSVHLFVTSQCYTETAKHRIVQTMPHDSPETLVF